jgi:hypothetical protein
LENGEEVDISLDWRKNRRVGYDHLDDFMMSLDFPAFIPGLKLCEYFYVEAVRPILEDHFSGVPHSAARFDYGSDVLGFDTPLSRDHGWGPKVMLFLTQKDYEDYKDQISEVMANELPTEIRGYPTNYDVPFSGDGCMQAVAHGPVRHWVAVTTIPSFFRHYLGVDPTGPISDVDWLIMPQQHLRTIISGKVFHDGLDQLQGVRNRLRWYPRDIWYYLLANQWRRIDQEEPFMARCGHVGDDLGSRIVATRQIVEIMHLCFLIEKQYAPYYKWFGAAFGLLNCAPDLNPIFHRVLESNHWKDRERYFSDAFLILMEMHNRLSVTPAIEPKVSSFYNRPYQVPHSARYVDALHGAIQSDVVRGFPRNVGSMGQFVDSTDILSDPGWGKVFKTIYQ